MCPGQLFGGRLISLQESEAALGTGVASGPLHQFPRQAGDRASDSRTPASLGGGRRHVLL